MDTLEGAVKLTSGPVSSPHPAWDSQHSWSPSSPELALPLGTLPLSPTWGSDWQPPEAVPEPRVTSLPTGRGGVELGSLVPKPRVLRLSSLGTCQGGARLPSS